MSIQRSQLTRGAAVVTFNGGTFYTRDDIVVKMTPTLKDVLTSMYGKVDKVKTDTVLKVPLMLWGAYENLSILFPSVFLGGAVGQNLYGGSAGSSADIPLVILSNNGDQITFANAAITKVSDLRLGVDNDFFSAAVELTCILGSNGGAGLYTPQTSGAYFTILSGQAYSDDAFAKTYFLRARFTGSWGDVAGMTTGSGGAGIAAQDGFQIGWQCEVSPVVCDGYGTIQMTVDGFIAQCKCIPIGPTMAQIDAASILHNDHGTLLSKGAADLTLTGTNGTLSSTIVLKNAGISDHGFVFSRDKLRNGEIVFETTKGFAAGVPQAISTVA